MVFFIVIGLVPSKMERNHPELSQSSLICNRLVPFLLGQSYVQYTLLKCSMDIRLFPRVLLFQTVQYPELQVKFLSPQCLGLGQTPRHEPEYLY